LGRHNTNSFPFKRDTKRPILTEVPSSLQCALNLQTVEEEERGQSVKDPV